jgi:hypothetical protein
VTPKSRLLAGWFPTSVKNPTPSKGNGKSAEVNMDSERQAMRRMIELYPADEVLSFPFGLASLRLDQNICDAFQMDCILIDGLVDFEQGHGRELMESTFAFCKNAGFQICVLTATREACGFYDHIGMTRLVDNIYYKEL